MKNINQWAMAALLSAVSMSGVAADELFQDAGSWLQVVGESSLKAVNSNWDKGRIWLEAQSHFDDNWTHWNQGVVRTALGYSLSDRATIWMGYNWIPTQNIGRGYLSEQDVWPAFRYVLPTDSGTFMFRTMVESNFIKGSEARIRPRQMIRVMYPLNIEPRLSLIAWDEFFIRVNSTKYGGQSGFDQNRAFAGLGWSFNKHIRAETGYMNQYVDDATHTNNTMNHLIMGSLFINF